MDKTYTEIWKLYEEGKNFQDKMQMLNRTNMSYRFYEGDQWNGLDSGGEKMPIIDVIKPIVDFKSTILTQNSLSARYTSMNLDLDEAKREAVDTVCDNLAIAFNKFWENNDMDAQVHEIVKDSIISGDSHLYMRYVPNEKIKNGEKLDGRIEMELIPNTNIMFSNENEPDIEKQEYILLVFRRSVSSVKAEAKLNGVGENEINKIVPDDDKDRQPGTNVEVENKSKCLCVMKFWKDENGKVHVAESTKNVVYLKDKALPLTKFPIASYVWERKRGLCRGVSDVYRNIPNQIWINRMEAYRLISAKLFAFPKMVYSSTIINKKDIDCVGVALEVNETDVQKALEAIGYLNPAPMSQDAKLAMDELVSYTKDSAGASDLATGRDAVDNYSVMLAVKQSADAPLKKQTDVLKSMLERIARLVLDFWKAYFTSGVRFEIETPEGKSYMNINLGSEELKNIEFEVKVDITPTSPFNMLTEQQKLDNLLLGKQINFEEYVSCLDKTEPMRPKLERIIAKRNEMLMQQQMQQQNDIAAYQEALDMSQAESLQKDQEIVDAFNYATYDNAVAEAATKE